MIGVGRRGCSALSWVGRWGCVALEDQAALAGALGQGLHAAVELISAAVEDHGVDAGFLRPGRQQLARLGRLLHRLEGTQPVLGPLDRSQRVALVVVDELGEQPAVGAKHRDPRALGRAAHLRAHTAAPLEALRRSSENGHARLPTFRATYSPW